MQPCLSNSTIPRAVQLKTIVLYCRRNARFLVHTSPPRKFSECAARFLIRPDCSNHWRHVPSLVWSCIANLNQRDMEKQLLTPLRHIARMNFSLKNGSCELFNLTRTVGKVELISTFTKAVCESWNVSDKYTWDNAGDLKQLSMDQTRSEDNRSD